MNDFDPQKAIDAAKTAVYLNAHPREQDREDIEALALLKAFENHLKGYKSGARGWRFNVLFAMEQWYGTDRNSRGGHHLPGDDELAELIEPHSPPIDEIAILRKRLSDQWHSFTDLQQSGLLLLLEGGYGALKEEAKRLGTSGRAIVTARRRALKRLNKPHDFVRRAKVRG